MLCPAVGLEHSKKASELLCRRILWVWRHNTNLGATVIGTPLSNVSFTSGKSSKIGDILLDGGVYIVFATFNLDKYKVAASTIANISIASSYPANASLDRSSDELIHTVSWDTKTLVALHNGAGPTVVDCRATIYGNNIQVDAVTCSSIYAVKLK